jgi:hypothetical protein
MYIKKLLIIYICISIIDIIYSGGIPILWNLMPVHKNYTFFGVLTLHGLGNRIVFFTAALMFLLAITINDKKYLLFNKRNYLFGALIFMYANILAYSKFVNRIMLSIAIRLR